MPRIAKSEVKAVLQETGDRLLKSSSDPFVSRKDAKKAAAAAPTEKEAALTAVFYGFVDHRDFKAGARVTGADVSRAVAYAAEHMVDRLDTNGNGLRLAKGSTTVKLAAAIIAERRNAAKVASAS
jgi:hypothetical protein